MKEGQGKLTYPDGAYYEGEFAKNRMHGYGTLYYRVGKPAYEGNWFEDQFHGKGVLYNENPVDQLQPFDYSDFNLVEDYWIRYEGKSVLIQANLNTITSTGLVACSWPTESTSRVSSKRTASTAPANSTTSTALFTPALGTPTS